MTDNKNRSPCSKVVGEIWYRWRGPRGGWIFDNKKPAWPCDTVEVRIAGNRDWGIPDSRFAFHQDNADGGSNV